MNAECSLYDNKHWNTPRAYQAYGWSYAAGHVTMTVVFLHRAMQ